MSKTKMTGVMVNGSLRSAGVTFYTRQGKTIARTSRSNQPKRRSRGQFDVRMRTRHSANLWSMIKKTGVSCFSGEGGAYNRFRSMAFSLPAIYVTHSISDASFLIPGIPVSEGTLPQMELTLGTIDGQPALLTDLRPNERLNGERMLLFTAFQDVQANAPFCRFAVREIADNELSKSNGRLALKGAEFGDNMKGWALVRTVPGEVARFSTQTIVTRCELYRQYTTEEALQAAADTYGGLTK